MQREEFMQKFGISCYDGLYHFSYREKNIMKYISELENDSEEPNVDDKCVDYFMKKIDNVPDGFRIIIVMLGKLHNTNELVYSINITNDEGTILNTMFTYDCFDDEKIDRIINSLCKAMYLKSYRMVDVKYIILWSKYEFERYYKDYLEEVK